MPEFQATPPPTVSLLQSYVQAEVGPWDYYRAEADVSGPLGMPGEWGRLTSGGGVNWNATLNLRYDF
ncbi:hypothetical protein DBADOPDK_03927 [Pseudomonas sp. MM223]|nr:hypothetical protein DBADOPDK_03927 [Pseudomonas sp. MM223]